VTITTKTGMLHSRGKLKTHDRFPTGTRLRPDWAPHPFPNTVTPNKASVEIEAALVLMLTIGLPLWSLIFSPLVGSVVAIAGNFLQRAMWDFT